jgi:rhodanese-related sulfurtransferase
MEDITAEELARRKASSEKMNIIDVREIWEHQENNIGGLNIPLGSIPTRLSELQSLKDQELIVYCRTGNRSGKVKQFLQQQGFSQVRNLIGGIEAMSIVNP